MIFPAKKIIKKELFREERKKYAKKIILRAKNIFLKYFLKFHVLISK